MKKIYTTCIGILNFFIINMFASILLSILYRGNIWLLYNSYHKNKSQWKKIIWNYYMEKHAASISIDAIIASPLILPHGVTGIFITQSANIGKNVVVFQQVTIGANTIKSSKSYGAPTIEDNVYIGAGAKIIGNAYIGHNSRIGANAVVVKTIKPNTIVVPTNKIIESSNALDNTFVPYL